MGKVTYIRGSNAIEVIEGFSWKVFLIGFVPIVNIIFFFKRSLSSFLVGWLVVTPLMGMGIEGIGIAIEAKLPAFQIILIINCLIGVYLAFCAYEWKLYVRKLIRKGYRRADSSISAVRKG